MKLNHWTFFIYRYMNKYIKSYKLFIEANDYDPSDVSMAKENLEDIKKKLSEYKSNISKIDNLYKNGPNVNPADLEKIVGKEPNRNEFLVSYANVIALEARLKKLKDSESDKATEISEFKDRLSNAEGDSRMTIQNRLDALNDGLKSSKEEILKISKDLPNLFKEHTDKMKGLEDKIKNWVERISK